MDDLIYFGKYLSDRHSQRYKTLKVKFRLFEGTFSY